MNRNISLIAVAAIVAVGIAIGVLLTGAGQTGPLAGALVPNESMHFGARAAQTVYDNAGTPYAYSQGTAQTDGIISAIASASFETGSHTVDLRGSLPDGNVVLARDSGICMNGGGVTKSITMPIRQGESWQVYVEWEGSATRHLIVYWIPITG